MAITLESRVLGCWQGKSAGGTLGLPAEGRQDRQHYTFYDPIPTVVPPNDDLELQLVWLDRMENHRGPLTVATMADAWLSHIHYMWDEYGRARWNLRRGVAPAHAGVFENPFASGMGSPIRSEIWAVVAAGDPDLAERFAILDSTLDHGAEGIAGEVFFAVLQALVLDGASLPASIEESLRRIDPATETRRALELVFSLHRRGSETWAAREALIRSHPTENFTHAPLNVALTMWALLYGAGDFGETILLAVNGGYDTDCTAATAGAILGSLHGAGNLPAKWIAPLSDEVAVGVGIIGIRAPRTISELTKRTVALRSRADELAPALPTAEALCDLCSLPGTISVQSGTALVPWANGELPPETKSVGKASWSWNPNTGIGRPYRLIALAKAGIQLWIDGEKIIDSPKGTPFVPATHRSADGSYATFVPRKDSYDIRVELGSANPEQAAAVILADAALHIAPWNGTELPHGTRLADHLFTPGS